NGRAPAAMTEPERDLAIPVPCRVPACALPRSYALRFTMPALPGPTFWWDTPSAATTCERLRTCTWARLRGWYWLMPIQPTSNRSQREKRNIEDTLGFFPNGAIVVTRLPSTSRCRRYRRVLVSHHGPVRSSFFGAYRKLRGLQN